MKLKTQIVLLVVIILLFSVGSITVLSYFQFKSILKNQLEDSLFNIAYYVSEDYVVKDALTGGRELQDFNLNKHIESIRLKTDVDFITIFNMEAIRLTHPNEKNIGLRFKGGDEERALKGEEYISEAEGTLGMSMRAFTPIYQDGTQIGAVSVGAAIEGIMEELYEKIESLYPIIIVGFLLGVSCAAIVTANIKKEILGLEPNEITLIFKEKEAILENVKEGIITLDKRGNLIQYNKEAARILGLTKEELGKNTAEIMKVNTAYKVVGYGLDAEDLEVKIRPGVTILCKYSTLRDAKNQVIGQVVNFRDLTEVKKLAEELTGIKKMTWSLRAQNHEFMNKLHIISGLIQLEEYDSAVNYISTTVKSRDKITEIITKNIQNLSVSALILAKYFKAEELRIKFEIDEQSRLSRLPKYISEEDIGTIIGNLVENSFDAVSVDGTGRVYLSIVEEEDALYIEVKDNGPGISREIKDRIYEFRFSTKSDQRGYGMYIVKDIIDFVKGKIDFFDDKGTTWLVEIPIERSDNV